MAHGLSRRLGKLLFPHLPRDQRKHQMSTLTAVLIFSLIVAGTLAIIMLRLGKF
jgi:hypothetical protein